jgi:hypothetical protein
VSASGDGPGDGLKIVCPSCGTVNDPAFDGCWSCGAALVGGPVPKAAGGSLPVESDLPELTIPDQWSGRAWVGEGRQLNVEFDPWFALLLVCGLLAVGVINPGLTVLGAMLLGPVLWFVPGVRRRRSCLYYLAVCSLIGSGLLIALIAAFLVICTAM